jgi:ketosteroid isomerase-like protein
MRDVNEIFADIDSMIADKFLAHLTEDVVFRFGNGDPVVGHTAVREAVNGFWTTINGMHHHLVKSYDVGDTTIAQLDVEYERLDGKSVTVPNADVLIFEGDRVKNWQIYIDLAPVFAP